MKRRMSVVLGILLASSALGQEIKVTVSPIPPMVMEKNGELTGFDIEYGNLIAEQTGLSFEYIVVSNRDKLTYVKDGEHEIALAGITMTTKREEFLDFSHPYMHTGLRIAARDEAGWTLMGVLWHPQIYWAFVRFLVCIAIGGVVIWVIERRSDKSNVKSLEDGIQLAHTSASTIGYGEVYPVTRAGKVLCILMFFVGAIMVADVISTMSAIKTTQAIGSEISSVSELSGQVVGTVSNSTSVAALEDLGARVLSDYDNVEQAFMALVLGEVEFVVYDAPAILYAARNRFAGKVVVVGPMFEPQDYGIAMTPGSEYKEKINQAILSIAGDGRYNELYVKWFGEK